VKEEYYVRHWIYVRHWCTNSRPSEWGPEARLGVWRCLFQRGECGPSHRFIRVSDGLTNDPAVVVNIEDLQGVGSVAVPKLGGIEIAHIAQKEDLEQDKADSHADQEAISHAAPASPAGRSG